MAAKTWDQMTDAERAEINRQENERERYDDFLAGDDGFDLVTDEDLAEYFAREEERADGIHKDSLYW
jgi:hypothetical protein